jgi:choline kinase
MTAPDTAAATPLPAVVLAAGFGSRLEAAAGGLPKALVPVLGRPLLAYTLDGLAEAGVREVVVVVGYRGDTLAAALRQMQAEQSVPIAIDFVRNPRFTLPNGSSLAAARPAVGGRPFLLLMADHLLSSEAIGRMVAAPHALAVGLDRAPLPPARFADATKVRLNGSGLVSAFGKQLELDDGVDAGIFRCSSAVFEAIDAAGSDQELAAIMTAVAARHPVHAVDLTGAFWLDVDTPGDLADAEAFLRHG